MQPSHRDSSEGPTLDTLAPGESGVVERIDRAGPLGERLFDLGFVPGTRVTFVRSAPLGDPLCFSVRGAELCLRRCEARRIAVQRVS